jgi:thiamine-phosphate pyrophosphorylase
MHPRPSNIPFPIVCVITRVRGDAGSRERAVLLDRLKAAAEAGASMIQVRERQVDDRACLHFAGELLHRAGATGCRILINERADIALASGAHGVHLKADGVNASRLRTIAGSDFLIGRSVHSTAEAIEAESDGGCDYLFFGTVFPSQSKAAGHPIAGVDALRDLCAQVSLPVVAIGGISLARTDEVARAGAKGVAAISLFAEAGDTAETVWSLRASLTRHSGRV